jgi:hypothetical protein
MFMCEGCAKIHQPHALRPSRSVMLLTFVENKGLYCIDRDKVQFFSQTLG